MKYNILQLILYPAFKYCACKKFLMVTRKCLCYHSMRKMTEHKMDYNQYLTCINSAIRNTTADHFQTVEWKVSFPLNFSCSFQIFHSKYTAIFIVGCSKSKFVKEQKSRKTSLMKLYSPHEEIEYIII